MMNAECRMQNPERKGGILDGPGSLILHSSFCILHFPREVAMTAMNRREFLRVLTAGSCAGACGVSCTGGGPGGAARDAGGAAPAGPLDIGAASDYARDGAYDRFAEDGEVLLIVGGGRLIATSAICTHRRATLRVKGGEIVCPKHGSRFGPDGRPLNGPARTPLDRYPVSVGPEGRVVVDRSRVLRRAEWEQPGSYVTVGG
jgi:cytochrome b6-f complex iron-sulfur subunit